MKKNILRQSLALPIFILASCIGSSSRVAPKFWQQKPLKIGIGISNYHPQTYASEKYMTDDEKFKLTEGEEKIIRKAGEDFENLLDEFIRRLNEFGFQAHRIPGYIRPKLRSKFRMDMDLTDIATKEKVDFVILFDIHSLGILSRYDKEGNLLQSSALFNPYGLMVEIGPRNPIKGRFQNHLWMAGLPEIDKIAHLDSDWKQPPDYPKLKAALGNQVQKAKEYFFTEFFKDAQSK